MGQREKFVQGMLSRVGGRYCSYPNFTARCADCSTTIAQEYKKATGQEITGSSHAQAKLGSSAGRDWRRWVPGDILVYLDGGHTGVYVGNGEAVHAMNEQMGVIKGPVDTEYWNRNFVDARRLKFSDDGQAPEPDNPDRPRKRRRRRRRIREA
jgi:cell wall-associated NlpC family hydrolase